MYGEEKKNVQKLMIIIKFIEHKHAIHYLVPEYGDFLELDGQLALVETKAGFLSPLLNP